SPAADHHKRWRGPRQCRGRQERLGPQARRAPLRARRTKADRPRSGPLAAREQAPSRRGIARRREPKRVWSLPKTAPRTARGIGAQESPAVPARLGVTISRHVRVPSHLRSAVAAEPRLLSVQRAALEASRQLTWPRFDEPRAARVAELRVRQDGGTASS